MQNKLIDSSDNEIVSRKGAGQAEFTASQSNETVSEITDDHNEMLALQITDLERAIRERNKCAPRTWPSALSVTTLLGVLVKQLGTPDFKGSPLFWALIAALVVGYSNIGMGVLGGLSRLRKAAHALACSDDPAAIGVMLKLLKGNETFNSIAGSALIKMLPNLEPNRLTQQEHEDLIAGLRAAVQRRKFFRFNPTLAVVMLATLGRVGTYSDLSVLRDIAGINAKTDEELNIRNAAHNAIATIEGTALPQQRPLADQASATGALDNSELEVITSKMREITRLRKRNLSITIVGALGGTGLAIARLAEVQSASGSSALVTGGMLGCLGLIFLFGARGIYAQRNLTNALMNTDDLRIIGPLASAAASAEISGATAAMVLTPLLLRLKASDANLLDSTTRDQLHWAMYNHNINRDFVLAALAALSQVGDARSIPAVQKAHDRAARGSDGDAVRAAARECLGYLELKQREAEANQTLLRASSAASEPAGALLRPAGSEAVVWMAQTAPRVPDDETNIV